MHSRLVTRERESVRIQLVQRDPFCGHARTQMKMCKVKSRPLDRMRVTELSLARERIAWKQVAVLGEGYK